MMKSLLILLVLVLTGCATQPIPTSQALVVPQERLLDSRYSQPGEGKGAVVVKRDSGFMGSACFARIFIDAMPMADLDKAEKVIFYLAQGDFVVSSQPKGVCGGGMSEVRASVKPGAELTFRVGYGTNCDFSINPTAF